MGAEGFLSACRYPFDTGDFCVTATGIPTSHPFTREDHALSISFILCPLCPYTASEHRRRMGRSSTRQTDGNRVKEAAGRAESCYPCSPSGTRRERPAGYWAWGREDLPISAGTGLWVNENCLVGEEKVREEARWPGLCCRAEKSSGPYPAGCRGSSPASSGAHGPSPSPSCQDALGLPPNKSD